MAYEFHIERANAAIDITEWEAAVSAVDGVRLSADDAVLINPLTGSELRMAVRRGDAEVLFPLDKLQGEAECGWRKTFRFSNGSAAFIPPENWGDISHPLIMVAIQLAKILRANIVGDEGEFYEW